MPTKSPMRRNRTSIAGTKKRKRAYKAVQCFDTKAKANAKKKTMHTGGFTATVRKKPKSKGGKAGWCVYSAGKRK